VPGTPSREGVQEASGTDARDTSADPSRCRGADVDEFTVLKWPPQSPDLNLIEHMDVVEWLRAMDVHPTNLHQLQDAIKMRQN